MITNVEQEYQILRLSGLLKALRNAVRDNDFRVAQKLRCELASIKQRFKGGLHDQLDQLFVISGQWVLGGGHRHEDKILVKQLINKVLGRFKSALRRDKRRAIGRGSREWLLPKSLG
jgi:hypothetical protein